MQQFNMKEGGKFIRDIIVISVLMGIITFIEIYNFRLFKFLFDFLKTPSAWFVALSLSYSFSDLFKKKMFLIVSNKLGKREDFFLGFVFTVALASMLSPYIKNLAMYFFDNFFVYFHVVFMQSMILFYIFFKVKNNYEVSEKYFLANEIIVLVYTVMILSFVI